MNSIRLEEVGDQKCPMHLWHIYLDDNGKSKYRECERCWVRQVKSEKGDGWTDKRIW